MISLLGKKSGSIIFSTAFRAQRMTALVGVEFLADA
jgi:hypothetical protein